MSTSRHSRLLIGVSLALACAAAPAAASGESETAPTSVADVGWTSPKAAEISAVRASLRNTRFLTPRAGVRLITTQPRLRWRGLPGGTTRVNLQIFRVDGGKATTVVSIFSSGRSYRLPKGRLAPDGVYLWRVWPERGRQGYTAKPLGVSFFTTSPTAS